MSNNAEDIANEIRQTFNENYRRLQEEYGNDPAVDLDLNYDLEIGGTRRPVFMVRGEQITHEQSVQVLSAMEPLFQGWDKNDLTAHREFFDHRKDRGALRTCLFREGYPWVASWLLSDGTIGGNILEFKYPWLWEILPQWVELAKACPFLNMAVGYTTVDESICWHCKYSEVDFETLDYYDDDDDCDMCPGPDDEYHVEQRCVEECKRRKELFRTSAYEKRELYNFHDRGGADEKWIKLTEYESSYAGNFCARQHHKEMHQFVRGCFIIKNGHISMYWGDAGRDRFKEYYDRYNDPYLAGLYGNQISSKWRIWSKNDVIDAFALKGLPAECYDIAVQHKFITEIPDDAPILTAEWLRKEHRAMCEKWNIPIE